MSNRSVHTDALGTLGTIIDEKQKRDAIHIAVMPMVAVERLHAGQDVGLVSGGASTKAINLVGIVDPYLKTVVQPGQRFWMLLYPRMVTSLRHVWSHPQIADDDVPLDKTEERLKAEEVVKAMADDAGIPYTLMLQYAHEFSQDGEWKCEGGRWEGVSAGDDFWNAYEIVTGEKVGKNERGSIFTCSC